MIDMCIAAVITDGVETDLQGAGLTAEEAVNNIGIDVDTIVELYRVLGFHSYVIVKQGYERTVWEFETLQKVARKNSHLI